MNPDEEALRIVHPRKGRGSFPRLPSDYAVMTEIRGTARSTYSQRCQWCDPLSLAQLILRPHRPDCPAAIAAVALGTP